MVKLWGWLQGFELHLAKVDTILFYFAEITFTESQVGRALNKPREPPSTAIFRESSTCASCGARLPSRR